MATVWSDEETFKLIELWSEDYVQEQLNISKRNAHIFEKLASQMKDAGFDRSATQCSNKIKKLRAEYRKRKDKKKNTGEGNKPWVFFEAMDGILGHRPATCPPVIIDSARSTCTNEAMEEKTKRMMGKLSLVGLIFLKASLRIQSQESVRVTALWISVLLVVAANRLWTCAQTHPQAHLQRKERSVKVKQLSRQFVALSMNYFLHRESLRINLHVLKRDD